MLLKILLAPSRPPSRQFHRSPRAARIRRILRTFVERHNDVRPQPDLRLHRALRTEEMRGTIQVRAERDPVFCKLPQLTQTEDLKSAGIGKNRAIPRHEAMQPAHPPHDLNTWPEVKVIGIPQDDLRPEFLQGLLRHAFDGCDCSHRHEDRRFDRGMWYVKSPSAPLAVCLLNRKFESHERTILPLRGARQSHWQSEDLQISTEVMNFHLHESRQMLQRLTESTRPSTLDNPEMYTAQTHVEVIVCVSPTRVYALRRQRAIVRPGEHDMKSLASETLESSRRNIDRDRLLVAQIVPQLVARRLICIYEVVGPDIATNKLHQIIHVLVALLGKRKQVAALQRAERVTTDHHQ